MNHGYIRLNRSLYNHSLWTCEPFTRGQAWVDMLLMARYRPGFAVVRGRAIELDAGQFVLSEEFAANRWRWSRGKVRRFLSEIGSKTVQQVVLQSTPVGTIVTICNWAVYQSDMRADEQQAVQHMDQLADGSRTSRGHLADTDNKVKKGKRRESKEISCPTPRDASARPVAVVSIPILGDEEFPVTAEMVAEWSAAYPAVDVEAELHKCRSWNLANPTNRKTARGVLRHINSWLSRAQNAAPRVAAAAPDADDGDRAMAVRSLFLR